MNISRRSMLGIVGMNDLGENLAIPAEAGQQPVKISCPSGSTIQVARASYGSNCSPANQGNKTSLFSRLCSGKGSCSGTTQAITDPDPAPGCAKDFQIDWSCSMPGSVPVSSFDGGGVNGPLGGGSLLGPAQLRGAVPAPRGSIMPYVIGVGILGLLAAAFVIKKRKSAVAV